TRRPLASDRSLRRRLAQVAWLRAELIELTAAPADALPYFQQAEALCAQLVGADAGDRDARMRLAQCVGKEGLLLLKSGDLRGSRTRLKEALALWNDYLQTATQHGADPVALPRAWRHCYFVERGWAELASRDGWASQARAALARARDLAERVY